MTDIADFLRARYQEARKQEEGVRSMRGNLGIQWEYRYDMDEEYVLINGHQRVDVNQFWEQYGEPTADPTVLADLDAKLAIVDDLLAERHEVVEGDCWYTCAAATEEHDGGETCDSNRRGGPCDCGRDARVERRLRLLARPFAGHPDYKTEEWAVD